MHVQYVIMLCMLYIFILCVVCQYVCSVVCCTLAWKNGFAECQNLNNKSINEKIHTMCMSSVDLFDCVRRY